MRELMQWVKDWYTMFGIGATLFGLAWGVRLAHEGVKNHLTHIEKDSARATEILVGLHEATKVAEQQHAEQIRLLGSIDSNLRR